MSKLSEREVCQVYSITFILRLRRCGAVKQFSTEVLNSSCCSVIKYEEIPLGAPYKDSISLTLYVVGLIILLSGKSFTRQKNKAETLL